MSDGIKVETTTTIDWYSLGMHLADIGSDEQSAFLDGFAASLFALGPVNAANQIQYIAESVHGRTPWLAKELAEATS